MINRSVGPSEGSESCKHPIRVAILGTRGIPARYGGFETFAEEISRRLADDPRFEVTVTCPAECSGPLAPLGKVKRLAIPHPNLGPFTTILHDFLSVWTCRKDYDLVYMLGYATSPFLVIPRFWRTRIWVNMDGLEWRRSKWNLLGRTYLWVTEWIASRSAHCMVADARAIQAYLTGRYGVQKRTIFLAYGANSGQFNSAVTLPEGLKPREYFLAVARLEPENQIKEIIEGFLASNTPYPLVVVGGLSPETPYIRHLKAMAGSRVKLIGHIYDRDLLSAMRHQAYAFFHGHTVGGTNPSLLEAIGAGRPIVAHDNEFNREVTGSLACFFKGSADIPGIVAEIVPAMAADASLAESSKKWLDENYSWEGIAQAYTKAIMSELSVGELVPRDISKL